MTTNKVSISSNDDLILVRVAGQEFRFESPATLTAEDLAQVLLAAGVEAEHTYDEQALFACDACAEDIKVGGVSDDEGRLELTGRVAAFHELCALCGAGATHEVIHAQEVK